MSAGEPYRELACCRMCGSPDIETVLELTPTPPANNLITAEELGREPARYPLVVCRTLPLLRVP